MGDRRISLALRVPGSSRPSGRPAGGPRAIHEHHHLRPPPRTGPLGPRPQPLLVGFTIRHLGVSKVRGHFHRFDVDLIVGDTLDDTTVAATIDVASLDTGNADRDAHVLSPDLIDVARRPTMVFRSDPHHRRRARTGRVEGELTIGDVTRPIVLAVEFGGVEVFPGGPRHAGFEATAELRRKEFGIDLAMPPGVSAVALGRRREDRARHPAPRAPDRTRRGRGAPKRGTSVGPRERTAARRVSRLAVSERRKWRRRYGVPAMATSWTD